MNDFFVRARDVCFGRRNFFRQSQHVNTCFAFERPPLIEFADQLGFLTRRNNDRGDRADDEWLGRLKRGQLGRDINTSGTAIAATATPLARCSKQVPQSSTSAAPPRPSH